MGTKRPCQDHLGREYPSVPDMCAAWGIPASTYRNRLGRGWTQEQALSIPNGSKGPKVNPRSKHKIRDHLGQEFVSIPEMCRRWEISEKVYWSRKRLLKWPLEKILTEPVRGPKDTANAVPVKDHLGQEFASISDLCRHWGIGLSTYRERRKRGWPMEQALTGAKIAIKTDAVPCRDHLGQEFPSKNAMCRHWGVTRYCYESRLALGWSQERALCEKTVINAKPCTDHMGRQFPAAVYMALYLGFPKYALHAGGGDLGRLVPHMAEKYWQCRPCGQYLVVKCLAFPWFLASYQNNSQKKLVLHFEDLLSEWHRTDFQPLPESRAKDPSVKALKLIQWPWYLCEINKKQQVLSYKRLIQLHMESNYGLSDLIDNGGKDT